LIGIQKTPDQNAIIILQKNVNSVANSRNAMTALRLRDSRPVADLIRDISPGIGKARRKKIPSKRRNLRS
jgi:hypothetical protein